MSCNLRKKLLINDLERHFENTWTVFETVNSKLIEPEWNNLVILFLFDLFTKVTNFGFPKCPFSFLKISTHNISIKRIWNSKGLLTISNDSDNSKMYNHLQYFKAIIQKIINYETFLNFSLLAKMTTTGNYFQCWKISSETKKFFQKFENNIFLT